MLFDGVLFIANLSELLNRYPDLSEDEFAAKCPYCRKNCNCKGCLRMQGVEEVHA